MMNYSKLGLKVGLEIHQQLDTNKLFCKCPSELVDEKGREVLRNLRPVASELGEFDQAAIMEAAKGLKFRYQSPGKSSCLVELDEEPPEGPNEKAVEVALKMALFMKAKVLDEIQFMRKIVIDGSNTAGFQRTSLLAVDGTLEVNDKEIGIPSICLEEDAARSIDEKDGVKTYRLDRLGIPLVEIVTSPVIESPEEAKTVAQTIGGLLRATRMVKRGLGTIREDVNISITKGARVEIKGVQDLRMLPEFVREEVQRQIRLLKAREVLRKREAEPDTNITDLTAAFKDTKNKIIAGNLKRGQGVYGIRLKGFGGTLRGKWGEAILGQEFASYAKTVGVSGIFHSDELPGYGITQKEINQVLKKLSLEKKDAFVMVSHNEDTAKNALEMVIKRALMALDGVPEETRNARLDSTTEYSRPISGRARMYPETDIPPYNIHEKRLEKLSQELPETPKQRVKRYLNDYELNREQSIQLFRKGYDLIFEEIADTYGNPSVVANTFLQSFPELEREGYEPSLIEESTLKEIFKGLSEDDFAKEGVPEILKYLSKGKNLDDALASAGIEEVDMVHVRDRIRTILDERHDFIKERGISALGPLMGVVMKEFRGKVDGKKLSNILKEELLKRV